MQAARHAASCAALPYDVYVVLDFEATCERGRRIASPEVIELPLVLVDAHTRRVTREFRRYVRPTVQPRLSAFCTQLTGITQAVVNASNTFAHVLVEAVAFLRDAGLGEAAPRRRYCFVTCGDWDLRTMLPQQLSVLTQTEQQLVAAALASLSTAHEPQQQQQQQPHEQAVCTTGAYTSPLPLTEQLPPSWRCWCNIKRYMQNMQRAQSDCWRRRGGCDGGGDDGGVNNNAASCGGVSSWPVQQQQQTQQQQHTLRDLPDLLHVLGLPLRGHHHSGLDDSRNIAAVVCALLSRGCVLTPTWPSPPLPMACTATRRAVATTTSTSHKAGGSARTASPVRPLLVADTHRDALAELWRGIGATPAHTHDEQQQQQHDAGDEQQRRRVRLSHCMSRVLRHTADAVGVAMTRNAYVRVDELLLHLQRQPQLRPRHTQQQHVSDCAVSRDDLVAVVALDEKQRYRLAYGHLDTATSNNSSCSSSQQHDELYVTACQGHSLRGVQPDLRALTLHDIDCFAAVHGTSWRAWQQMCVCGYMSPMSRQYIHFAKQAQQQQQQQQQPSLSSPPPMADVIAVTPGLRRDAEVLVYLDMRKALHDGVALYESANGVVLTAGVGTTRQLPLVYLARAVCATTGAQLPLPSTPSSSHA